MIPNISLCLSTGAAKRLQDKFRSEKYHEEYQKWLMEFNDDVATADDAKLLGTHANTPFPLSFLRVQDVGYAVCVLPTFLACVCTRSVCSVLIILQHGAFCALLGIAACGFRFVYCRIFLADRGPRDSSV